MKCAIFFAGSGQKARDASLIYTQWERRLEAHGYRTQLFDGVGEFQTTVKTRNWLGRETTTTKTTSKTTGKGWALIVDAAMQWLENKAKEGLIEKIVIVGMSRGGVQAVVFANCLRQKFSHVPAFVFAIDPVQGWHMGLNDGSFDMRQGRRGSQGSRDVLRATYGLEENAPNTLSKNVAMYLSVIMQFRGSQRSLPGFTPQSPSLQNMTVNCPHKVYELPGDHSTGVASGLAADGTFHRQYSSRTARSLVTTDMFYHWLRQEDFGDVGQLEELVVFDTYCRIANEDLAGVQFDNKRSGFSFLMASHPAAGRAFTADPTSRFHKGRGHLVGSSQVAASVKLQSPSMQGYYINERHFELYVAVAPRLQIEMRKPAHQRQGLSNIVAWITRNNQDFR